LAAVILEFTNVAVVFAVASAASLAAAVVLLRLRYEAPPRPAAPRGAHFDGRRSRGCPSHHWQSRLAMFTGLGMAQTFTRGALTVFAGAIGAGAVVGSLIASLLVGSRRLAEWFGIGVALWGFPVALIPLFPWEASALTLLACVGIGNALVDVGLFTLMARLAPDDVVARVLGLFESLITLAVGVGALVASLLIE
jgi:hypothetical protein